MQITLTPALVRDMEDRTPFLAGGLDTGFPSTAEADAMLAEIIAGFERLAAPIDWNSFWALAEPSGEAIGLCGYKGPPGADGFAEIAYFTFPLLEGRGIATAMARTLIDKAQVQGASAVCAHTLPEENASTKILGRLGFAFIGAVEDPEDGTVWRWERGFG